MNWRRWVSLLALAGVLLHAAAIARHNGFALVAALDALSNPDAIAASALCSPTADTAADHAATSAPDAPAKSTERCPVCGGMTVASALPAVDAVALPLREKIASPLALTGDTTIPARERLRPSSRGPPLSV